MLYYDLRTCPDACPDVLYRGLSRCF